MFEADAAHNTRRFRVSYTFTDRIVGDENAIRKALRDLSFSSAFAPEDVSFWQVGRTEDGQYLLAAQRTLVDELKEPSERAALRRFLYAMDCPEEIDVAGIRIERLDRPAEVVLPPLGEAA